MGKQVKGGDCGEMEQESGLWGNGLGEGTVGKGMSGVDCGEKDDRREGTV